MATPVPALDRAVAVLRFLADRPDGTFTLSEIARGADVHKATCAAVLAALAGHGMVRRDESRRYRLGPALVSLQHTYSTTFPAFLPARHEIWQFTAATGLSCSISALDADEIVVLDIAGDAFPSHLSHRIGERLAFRPPHGTIYRVWGEPEEVDAWLDQMVVEYGGDKAAHLATVSAIRTRGYALGSEQDFGVDLEAALRRAGTGASDLSAVSVAMMVADKIRNLQDSAEGTDDDEPVNFVVAPVFGRDGRVTMTLNAFGRPRQLRRRDVPRVGRLLLDATERITRSIGGVRPAAEPL